MTAPQIITVLVVDDDPLVRRGISDIFSAAPDISVVADADDGDQVPAKVSTFRPHVVLMDLKMKRVGGLAATTQLMTLARPPKVITMTSLDVDDLVVQSVIAGAHSFLSKAERPETFQLAVRAVAGGNTLFSEQSLRAIVNSDQRRLPAPTLSALTLSTLTKREREVLQELATGATNANIARQLLMSETTVKSHVTAIFTKVGARNRVEAALAAFRAGLVV